MHEIISYGASAYYIE